MISQDRLIKAAMALRAEAPAGWEEFVMAVRERAAATSQEFMRCSPDMLQRAQGMAIEANELAVLLMNAPTLAEKIQGRPNARFQA